MYKNSELAQFWFRFGSISEELHSLTSNDAVDIATRIEAVQESLIKMQANLDQCLDDIPDQESTSIIFEALKACVEKISQNPQMDSAERIHHLSELKEEIINTLDLELKSTTLLDIAELTRTNGHNTQPFSDKKDDMQKLYLLCHLLNQPENPATPIDIASIVETLESLKGYLSDRAIMNNSMFDSINGLLQISPLSDNPTIKELRASIIVFYQTHQYEFNRKPVTLERIAHVILDETLKSNPEHETNFEEVAQKFVQNSKVQGDLSTPPTSRLDDSMTDEEKKLFGNLKGSSIEGLEACKKLLLQLLTKTISNDSNDLAQQAREAGYLKHFTMTNFKGEANFEVNTSVTLREILEGLARYGSPAMQELILNPGINLENLFSAIDKHIDDIAQLITMTPEELTQFIEENSQKTQAAAEENTPEIRYVRQLTAIAQQILATKALVEDIKDSDRDELNAEITDLEEDIKDLEEDMGERMSLKPITNIMSTIQQKRDLLSIAMERKEALGADIVAQKKPDSSEKPANKFIPKALLEITNQGILSRAIGEIEEQISGMKDKEKLKTTDVINSHNDNNEISSNNRDLLSKLLKEVIGDKRYITVKDLKLALADAKGLVYHPQHLLGLAVRKMESELAKMDEKSVITIKQIEYLEKESPLPQKEKEILVDLMKGIFVDKDAISVKDFKAALKEISKDIPFYDFSSSSESKQDTESASGKQDGGELKM